MLYYNI